MVLSFQVENAAQMPGAQQTQKNEEPCSVYFHEVGGGRTGGDKKNVINDLREERGVLSVQTARATLFCRAHSYLPRRLWCAGVLSYSGSVGRTMAAGCLRGNGARKLRHELV